MSIFMIESFTLDPVEQLQELLKIRKATKIGNDGFIDNLVQLKFKSMGGQIGFLESWWMVRSCLV